MALLNGDVSQRHQERKFVGRREITLAQKPLQFGQKRKMLTSAGMLNHVAYPRLSDQ